MREGNVGHKFQIILSDLFKSKHFDQYPSEKQMKEFVSKHFPTFHVNGDPVTWKIEKIYFIED
jgi:hypothetical protein